MSNQKIFFITGASTSGKTTLIPELRKWLPEKFVVHDFDERGVPDNVTDTWRKKETTHWLEEGVKNAEQGKTTVICGISLPEEIEENKEMLEKIMPRYALLDVSSRAIRERFHKRLATKKMQEEWKRTVGMSLEKSVEQNIAFASMLRKDCQKYTCKVFNTSRSNIDKTALRIAHWIISQQ